MGGDVAPHGKAADNEQVVDFLRKVVDEAVDEVDAVDGGIAGADNAHHMGCVEVGVTQGEEHQRGIVALKQPAGIVFVGVIEGAYAVVGDKRQLGLGLTENLMAVIVGEDAAPESELACKSHLREGEKLFFRAEHLDDLRGHLRIVAFDA